jgi:hypothetical protein
MGELSVAEQRYQAVLAVIVDGLSISQVAGKVGMAQTPNWRVYPQCADRPRRPYGASSQFQE